MKIYKITADAYFIHENIWWRGTKKEAYELLMELKLNDDLSDEAVEEIEIPTTKKGLIGWLDKNFNMKSSYQRIKL